MRLTSRLFPRKHDQGIARLSSALDHSSADVTLDDLPEVFADLITRFEQADVHPGFRADILSLLNQAVRLAYKLVLPVHESEYATQLVSDQLAILGRLLVHLQTRPAAHGYSILMANTGRLVGLFATREEAERQLDAFHSTMGVSHKCTVVPAKVVSAAAVQPERRPVPGLPPVEIPRPDHTSDQAPMPGFLSKDVPPLEEALRPGLTLTPEADLGLTPSPGPGPGPLEVPPSLRIEPRK